MKNANKKDMREIKFRAWSEFNGIKQMLYSNTPKQNYRITPFGIFASDKHNYQYLSYTLFGENYPIMQFTGLKDKNGVEIYEGDIVGRGRGEIFFDTKRAQFRVRWHDTIWLNVRGNNQMYQDGEPIFGNHEIVFEVIGNIYQNPELL